MQLLLTGYEMFDVCLKKDRDNLISMPKGIKHSLCII